ncbi:MAG: nucleoside triphosphate pyrophosphatase [Phycisphaerales bacterium]
MTRARKLILASVSPRRSLLLREAGFAHETLVPPLDDAALDPGDAPPRRWVAALAYLKAASALRTMPRERAADAVLLGADTLVVKDGEMIGKPANADDARRILRRLSAGSHEVLTGAALVALDGEREILVDATRVRVGAIPEGVLEEYVASGQWEGKAGAYNLAERLEAGWPIEFEGDPGTIMGLPMRRLTPRLDRWLAGNPCAGHAS